MILKEIKRGEMGYGLLIENDGYISLDSEANKVIKESLHDDNNGWFVPNPFIVSAVFQKYGIKNANGRIYPEEILKREVERYMERVKERKALGECYTADAKILTVKGWKNIAEVTEDDNVLTLNTETNKIEFQKVTKKIELDFNGDLIHLKSKDIDEKVTPNHQYVIYRKNRKVFYCNCTAEKLFNQELNNQNKSYIPQLDAVNDKGIDLKKVKFEKIPYEGKVYCVETPNHTFYVSENNKHHWSHNCNHPSESVIDLERVSHNIIELHWEGSTLVGKMELNITEAFRRYGVCSSLGDTVANLLMNGYKIGVSSRGIGSVSEKYGVTMVGNDFELICWDVVSEPSTPGAYISTKEDSSDLTQYIESKEKPKNKTVVNEKINRLKDILL